MNVGRLLFYDTITGGIVVDTGEWRGIKREKTVDEQITTYSILSERNRESFDVLKLDYGQYSQDFSAGRLIGVNIETKVPIFEYPNPENPDAPIIPEKPLSVEVEELKVDLGNAKTQSTQTDTVLMEFMNYYFENGGM